MPRTARKKSKSGVYHIVLRGVNKQTVFYDDEDREVFLSRLKLAKQKYKFEIYAFCFMTNHIHLLIKESDTSIGRIMQHVLTSYVFWYNSKYERIGNLFQDRYKSEAVDNDEYLLCAVRYIHQNPVEAGIVGDAALYKWSSYSAYLYDNQNIIDTGLVLSMTQTKEKYKEFMKLPEEHKFLEPTERFRISDEKLIREIKKLLKMNDITEIYSLEISARNDKIKKILNIEGATPYQVSRVCGIPMGVIRWIVA